MKHRYSSRFSPFNLTLFFTVFPNNLVLETKLPLPLGILRRNPIDFNHRLKQASGYDQFRRKRNDIRIVNSRIRQMRLYEQAINKKPTL